MMDNEVSTALDYLNANSKTPDWMYIPWGTLKDALTNEKEHPLCLLGFRRKKVANDASPNKKYMFFYRKGNPRMSQKEFLETTGKKLLRHFRERFEEKLKIIAFLPSLDITKSITLFEAHEPPVEEATVKLELDITFTCIDSNITDIIELGSENGKEYLLKARKNYKDITSSFGLKFNGGGTIVQAGISSSILGDHLTSNVTVTPLGLTRVRVTAGNQFQGSRDMAMNGHNWKIEYKAGYKLDAIIDKEKNRQSNRLTPYPLKIRSVVPETDSFLVRNGDRRRPHNTWWDRNAGTVIGIGTGAAIMFNGIFFRAASGAAGEGIITEVLTEGTYVILRALVVIA